MADTLESLEIEVKHSAAGTADELNNVASAIRGISRALTKVLPNLKAFNDLLGNKNVNVTMNDNYTTQIADTITNVKSAATKAQGATKEVANGIKSLSKEASKSAKPLGNFLSSLKRIAFYRFIRAIIRSITEAFQEGLKNAYSFSQGISTEGHRFSSALDTMSSSGLKMKNQLGSAFISLLAAIAPIVNAIIGLIVKLADAMSQLFSAFTGSTYLKAKDVFQSWGDTAEEGAKAAKEWRNQILAFDEINRLEEPADSGSGGAGGGLSPSDMFVDTPLDDWAQKIHDNLALIELTASGFLLGLGCVLLFSGANIPLGLGLIALGVAGFVHALSENWDTVNPKVAQVVADIMATIGGALLAIGALLVFTGANIPLGIGLMLAGAAAIATSVAINWQMMPDKISSCLSEIGFIVGGALLALGIIILLATPAFSPLGLGLLIAGATVLAASVAVNWDFIKEKIQGSFGEIAMILSGFLLVLGVLLLFTPVGIPLGLGLILVAGTALATAVAINWDEIVQRVENALSAIKGFIDDVSEAIMSAVEWVRELMSVWDEAQANISANQSAFGIVDTGTYAAEGGIFSAGEVFIAREAGPEMVGTIGGHTAVANNDQIVAAIEGGVFRAMSAAGGSGNSGTHTTVIDINGREFFRATYDDQRAVARERGVTLITNGMA